MTIAENHKKTWIAAICITLALAVVAGFLLNKMFGADDDPELTITPDSVTVKDADIEVGTMVIGSHLIYVGALTDELYEIATDSASTFNQSEMYYKSEFANGTWYQITSAESLADISTSGTPVSADVIESLQFTHHTKSDGITYDLVTGEAVNIFDIDSPYDLTQMEELQDLVTEYQLLKSGGAGDDEDDDDGDDKTDVYIDLIKKFFATDVKTLELDGLAYDEEVLDELSDGLKEITAKDLDKYEAALEGLNEYIAQLGTDSSSKKRDIATDVMAQLSAERKAYVYARVYVMLANLSEDVQDNGSDSAVIEAIANCVDALQTSITDAEGDLLTEGSTSRSQTKYEVVLQLIDDAGSKDIDAEDADIEKLVLLDDIENGLVANTDAMLDMLMNDLLPKALAAYKEGLAAGTSDDYKAAAADGASDEVLSTYLDQNKSELSVLRMECEYLINMIIKIKENSDGQAFLTEKITEAGEMEALIPAGAMESRAKESRNTYEEDLAASLKELVSQSENGAATADLEAKRDDLLDAKNDALADNDYTLAKQIDALIAEVDDELEALEDQYVKTLASDSASAADKAIAAANLSSGSAGKIANNISEDAVSKIGEGNLDDALTAIDALASLIDINPNAATGALNDIKDALSLSADATDAMLNAVNSAIDTGNAKIAQAGQLSSSEIEDLLNTLLGTDFDNLSPSMQAAAVVAIERYGELKQNSAALSYAGALADKMNLAHNRYVYSKYSGSSLTYVSLKTLADCAGYRYVYENNNVTLSKGSVYFTFDVNSDKVNKNDGSTDTLTSDTALQTYLYVPADYVQDNLGCGAEYINESVVGVLYTASEESSIEEIYEALIEKGGN